ncbi:MlaD family protein [Nocardia aurantiaca]|uniref:MlaD family protein n=1 Tax=Nocardia aurantiaca TaxID=2675850 RepID=UPI002E1E66FF
MRFSALAVAVSVGSALAGCGFDPTSIPVPGSTVSGPTYRVHIEFSSALNLPAHAKVTANGRTIGSLDSVRVIDPSANGKGYVIADVDISRGVRLPASTTAQLRQNTVLGDIYLALTTPPDGFGATIPDNGLIPLDRTRPPLQIEDLLSGLATFVGGGAVTQFQDIVNRLNAGLPADPRETASLSSLLGTDFTDLATHLDQVSALGRTLEADVDSIAQVRDGLAELLSKDGATQVTVATTSIARMLGLLGAIGTILHGVDWLHSIVVSGDAAAEALVPLLFTGRPLDLNAPSNLNRLTSLLRDVVIPFVEKGPKVNITGLHIADAAPIPGDDQVDRILATLRMIGAVR